MHNKLYFMQQIDKAAKVIDLKGDFPRAVEVLDSILNHPEIANHPDVQVEVLAFLADIHMDVGRCEEAEFFLRRAESVSFSSYHSQATELSRRKLTRLKKQLGRQ
jgi:lipopolysaccharide biosynthesis regulator YciM